MDSGRRSRRSNRRNCRQPPSCGSPMPKSGGFLNGVYNFLIMSALMALIYLMLEYHCTTCKARCISKNIDDVTKNLSHLKNSYHDLEVQISRFSQELPRLEGQLEILETLTRALEKNDFSLGWDPRAHFALPNVDVYLAKVGCGGKNVSHLINPAHMDDCKNNTCMKRKYLDRQMKPKNVVYCNQ